MKFCEATIGQMLQYRAEKTPDETALIVEDGTYTWKEVNSIADHLAGEMRHLGIEHGDCVGIIGINSDSWIFHYYAAVKMGAVAVLLNTRFKHSEIQRCVELADIKTFFYSRNNDGIPYDEIMGSLLYPASTVRHCIRMERSFEQWKKVAGEVSGCETEPFGDSGAVASVLFTSGTTGNSKGVQLTHHSLLNNSLAMARNMGWTQKDVMCVVVPLFHTFGISGCILATLHSGACMYLLKSTRSVDIFSAIQKYRCTVMNGVPTMFLAMMRNPHRKEYDITSLKSGIIAGSQIFPQDYKDICQMFEGISLQPSYGQTETSPCVTMCSLDDSIDIKANTAGKVIPGVQIRIMKKGATEPCGTNVEGEIQVKGYNVMVGYIANPEESKAVFTEDGWLKTGDLGYIRDDGNLVITGRFKNLIIRGGENISPVEIEKAIKEIAPACEVKVIGVPTIVLQEDIVACIEHREDEELREKIMDYLKERISDYKIPQKIFFIEDMPRNSTGKINEKALKNKVIASMMLSRR